MFSQNYKLAHKPLFRMASHILCQQIIVQAIIKGSHTKVGMRNKGWGMEHLSKLGSVWSEYR